MMLATNLISAVTWKKLKSLIIFKNSIPRT